MTIAKKRSAFLFIIAAALLLAQNGFAQAPWKKIPVPQLPTFHPQEPKRIDLPNGMVIFLQEDHELPTVDGIVRIRGGSRLEPAAKVETNGNADSTTIALSCLKEDFSDVFKAFSDLLREPEFREDKLELAKREAFDGISRRNDEIDDIAHRESVKLAYGDQNPYARVPEYTTVGAVTRQDLLDWHHTYVQPN